MKAMSASGVRSKTTQGERRSKDQKMQKSCFHAEWQFDQNARSAKPAALAKSFVASVRRNVAIKRPKLTANQAAHRELDIAQTERPTLQNVVPLPMPGRTLRAIAISLSCRCAITAFRCHRQRGRKPGSMQRS